MDAMSTWELIVHDLERLSETQLKEAAGIIHQLSEKSREERLAALEKTSGCLSDAEAEEWLKAIEEGCEQVDPHEW